MLGKYMGPDSTHKANLGVYLHETPENAIPIYWAPLPIVPESKPSEVIEATCSASLDVVDCCTSLDEARDVIRRREKYANELMAWINERRNAPDSATLEMIQERLRPLCSIPNSNPIPESGE